MIRESFKECRNVWQDRQQKRQTKRNYAGRFNKEKKKISDGEKNKI